MLIRIGANTNLAHALAIHRLLLAINAKARPFAAFRGDYRRPLKQRTGGAGRMLAMNISPALSSSVRKFERRERMREAIEQ